MSVVRGACQDQAINLETSKVIWCEEAKQNGKVFDDLFTIFIKKRLNIRAKSPFNDFLCMWI